MDSKSSHIESKPLKKTQIVAGQKYAFSHFDFSVENKIIANYEGLEPINYSELGFENITFIPLITKISQNTQSSWTFLFKTYSPPLQSYVLAFPYLEILSNIKNIKDFLINLSERYYQITGLELKNYEILENIESLPNIFSDPGCLTERCRVINMNISLKEDEFRKLEENSELDLLEIEGNLCEKLEQLIKDKAIILSDKVCYWAIGKMFKDNDFLKK